MFHRFDELGPTPVLVRSTRSRLRRVRPVATICQRHRAGWLPARRRRYTHRDDAAARPRLHVSRPADDTCKRRRDERGRRPGWRRRRRYRWVDLDGEGIPGVLTAAGRRALLQAQLTATGSSRPRRLLREQPPSPPLGARGPARSRASTATASSTWSCSAPLRGFFERTRRRLVAVPPLLARPERRLERSRTCASSTSTATGCADVLDHRGRRVRLVPLARQGRLRAGRGRAQVERRGRGPGGRLRRRHAVHLLADMTGDGLVDLVRVRNGEVCYWPNLGYGRFGAQDHDGRRAALRSRPTSSIRRGVRFGDIDGSGTTDIVYLRPRRRRALLQSVRQRAGATPRRVAAVPDPPRRRASSRRRSPGQRHGLPGVVVAGRPTAAARDALRRPDGRHEAAPARPRSSNNLGRGDAPRLRAVDAVLPAGPRRRDARGSRGCRFRCTSWSASRHVDRVQRHAARHRRYSLPPRLLRRRRARVPRLRPRRAVGRRVGRATHGAGLFPERRTSGRSSSPAAGTHRSLVPHRRVARARALGRASRREYYQLRPARAVARRSDPARRARRWRRSARRRARCAARSCVRRSTPTTARPRVHPYTVESTATTCVCIQPHGGAARTPSSSRTSARRSSRHYERHPADPRVEHDFTLDVDEFGNVLRVGAPRLSAPRARRARAGVRRWRPDARRRSSTKRRRWRSTASACRSRREPSS